MALNAGKSSDKRSYNSVKEMADDLSPGAIAEVKKVPSDAEYRARIEKTRRTGETRSNPPASDINRP